MKTANQVHLKSRRAATNSQRQNQQLSASHVAAQIEQLRGDRFRPIDLKLPGIAGGTWDDQALLQYVCSVFACEQGCRLLATVARDRIAQCCSVVDFVEFCSMVRSIVKQPHAEQFTFPTLAGLSGYRTMAVRECLESVCIVVQNLNALILHITKSQLPHTVALPFADALMVTEAVSHRAGFATDLDDTPHTKIMRWAEALTYRVADELLDDALTEI